MKTYNILGYRFTVEKIVPYLIDHSTFLSPPSKPIKPNFLQKRVVKLVAKEMFLAKGWTENTNLDPTTMVREFFQVKIAIVKFSIHRWGWTIGQSKDVIEYIIGKTYDQNMWRKLF